MNGQSKPASFWFMLIILGIGLLLALTTIFVGYTLSSKPLGFLVWVTIGFLCFVEFLATILGINGLVGKHRKRRPSGAVLMISYAVVGLYTAVGLLSIVGYAVIRDDSGGDDSRFMAILIAETVLAFVVVTLIYAYDYFLASTSEKVIERREEHAAKSRSVRSVLATLADLNLADADLLARRDALVKRLQGIETALGHSHGGGVGSREGGWQHPADPDAEMMIDNTVGGLNATAARLAVRDPAVVAQVFDEMERLAAQLRQSLDRLQLL